MKAWIGTDEKGRVNASTTIEKYSTGMTEVEVDDDFDFAKQGDYRLVDGELVYDGAQTAEEEAARQEAEAEAERRETIDAGAAEFFADGGKEAMEQSIKDAAASGGADPQILAFARMAVVPMAASLTDEQALSVSSLWPDWSADSVSYAVDSVVQYNDHLWRCEQVHTSQASWTPDAAPSLWSRIDIADDGIDIWTQPTGAHNAYNIGDKVHYPQSDSPVYVSTINGNVWSPDAYPTGWKLDGEGGGSEGSEEPGGETYPEWVQPTGAHDAYLKGDKVSHNGKHWTSDVDGNVWEPGVYGWTEE